MNALPNTSTLTPEEIQAKLDALVTEVQSHSPSFLGRFSPNKQQRAFIRRFSFQTSFNDPILSLFDAAGVACPHKRNMVDAFTMAVNYALDPAADYTVGQLAKALGLSGKILTSATPISEKCKSRRLTVNNVLRILGKECTNIGLQSAKAIGYFSAANIIARKSITGACDDHAYTYVSYGYGETHQIKTAFVQGEKHPFKSGRETVFSYDSLSSLAGAKRLTPFELSADDEAKCGFYLGITAKQIREYTDNAIANKKHCKKELALLACLSGFTSYIDEWEELNAYAFEFLELTKALEAAKALESVKASAEGVAAPEQAPAVETTDKALESAGAKESHEAATVTAPAPKTEAATTESAGANESADEESFGFYYGIGGKDAASVNAVLFPDNKDAPKKINIGEIVNKGIFLGMDTLYGRITVGELANLLGIGGHITESSDWLLGTARERAEKEKAVRKARGLDEKLPACKRVNACMDADHLCTYLGKTDGTLGADSAKGLGYFAAAYYLAQKAKHSFAADRMYFYSNRKSPIRTGFVNGQTVFAVCSFPYISCRESGAYQIAGEYRNAGGELIHLNEEQQAKWGFEWGITAEQLQDFTNKAPELKLIVGEINGHIAGFPLFDKTALNQLYCLNAFVQYVAKWEDRNREGFESPNTTSDAAAPTTAEAVATAEPANEIEPTEPAGSTEAPAESAPAGKSAGAEDSTAPEADKASATEAPEAPEAKECAKPAPELAPAEAAANESAGAPKFSFMEHILFYTQHSGEMWESLKAGCEEVPRGADLEDIAFTATVLAKFPADEDLKLWQMAEILGIRDEVPNYLNRVYRSFIELYQAEEEERSRRGLADSTPAGAAVKFTLTADTICRLLGKDAGALSTTSAKAVGYFAAAFLIAQRCDFNCAADHCYLYVNFNQCVIKTGFVNGQTVFNVSSLPYFGEYGTFFSALERAGLKPLHLTEEQIAKCGFSFGVTADQLMTFAAKAPKEKLAGVKLYSKGAVNCFTILAAFADYVSEWEAQHKKGIEEINEWEAQQRIGIKATGTTMAAPAESPKSVISDDLGKTAEPKESAGSAEATQVESTEAAGTTASTSAESTKATESAGAAEQGADPAPLVAYFDQLLSESTEPNDGPETTQEQALQDYFKGMLADDTISGPSESTGGALAPAGSAALTVPATTPTLVPIVANRAAPSILRAVSLGLSPDAGANEEPEALEATPLEATSSHPLAPACGQVTRLSFKYYGHRYRLDYSDKGWRWTFDDYKDQCGRGFCFKADGMTLAEMLKSGLLGTDARYLGELVAYVENEHQINLGQFACHDLEEATRSYVWCRGFGDEDLPAAKLLGVKIYLPIYKSHGRMNLESRFEQADWQIDITAYSAPLLCSAGFSKANAAEFIKGWTNAILWRAEEELDRAQTSATAYDDDYTTDAGDFNDIPF